MVLFSQDPKKSKLSPRKVATLRTETQTTTDIEIETKSRKCFCGAMVIRRIMRLQRICSIGMRCCSPARWRNAGAEEEEEFDAPCDVPDKYFSGVLGYVR